jgi:hypothetical protein
MTLTFNPPIQWGPCNTATLDLSSLAFNRDACRRTAGAGTDVQAILTLTDCTQVIVNVPNPATLSAVFNVTTSTLTVSGLSPLDNVVIRWTDATGTQTAIPTRASPNTVSVLVPAGIPSNTIQVSLDGGRTFQCVAISIVEFDTTVIASVVCSGVGGSTTLTGLPPNSTGTLLYNPVSGGATVALQITTDSAGSVTVPVGLCDGIVISAAIVFEDASGVTAFYPITIAVP